MSIRSLIIGMAVLILVAAAARMPGIFWGVEDGHLVNQYHPDEIRLARVAFDIRQRADPDDYYPSGYAVQIGLIGRFTGLDASSADQLIVPGRWLSFCYGLFTIPIVYLLAVTIGQSRQAGLFSATVYALSGLSAVYSHYAVTDTALSFWFALTVLAALVAARTQTIAAFTGAVLSASQALAVKLALPVLIPVIATATLRKPRTKWLLLAILLPLVFVLTQNSVLWTVSADDMRDLMKMVETDNIRVVEDHNFLLNPLVYLAMLPAALGLPGFVSVLAGVAVLWRRSFDLKSWYKTNKDVVVVLLLPVIVWCVWISSIAVTTPRHILPLLPFLSLLAGFAWQPVTNRLSRRWIQVSATLALVYQALYLISIIEPYVLDSREKMADALETYVALGERVYVDHFAEKLNGIIDGRERASPKEADFILTHESGYRRFLRSPINPLTDDPQPQQVFHWVPEGHLVKSLFKGDTSFDEIHRTRALHLTPELQLYRAAWGTFPDFVGDTVLFARRDGR